MQAFRSLGLPASIGLHVHVKQRDRGYDEATMVESFVVLNAVGGECLEDFTHLREDGGLKEMLGHGIPSPEAAGENDALAGLGEVNRELVKELGRRCPEQRIATVDLDATIIESHKQQALHTYEGERGYQPMLAVWAEMDVILADEFRDGNVPAMMAPLPVA